MAKERGLAPLVTWIQEGLFFLACFLYLFLRVRPGLILELQAPVFFKNAGFLNEFLKIPGGLSDWLAALIMQFWFSDLIIALFLSFCFWLIAFLTRKWLEVLTASRSIHTVHLIPAVLLFTLHNQYDFQLSVTLAVIINLCLLVLFAKWAPEQQAPRAGLASIVAVLLYWITCSGFFIFAILGGLDDLIMRKQFVSGVLLLLVAAILPFAARPIFLITLQQAYLHNLVLENPVKLKIIADLFLCFYVLSLVIAALIKYVHLRKTYQKIIRVAFIWRWAAGTLLILAGMILLAQKARDPNVRLVLQVNHEVREKRWLDVLTTAQRYTSFNTLLSCQTNFALFQKGLLLERMFVFPQTQQIAGLLLDRSWCISWPEQASNLYWRMGLLSEAQHWAHEALEHKGATPDLLKRLGIVYMLKSDSVAAERFFRKLQNVPFQQQVAEELIRLNKNPAEIAKNNEYNFIQSSMPVEDFITLGKPSSNALEMLLKRNPRNRMAFEYLIAYYLLNGNLTEIWNRVPNFYALGYTQLPRHVQEALILKAALTPKYDLNQIKNWIHSLVYKRFLEYRQIVLKYQGNKNNAKPELQQQFSDTYWYYLLYTGPAAQQSEGQNDYQ